MKGGRFASRRPRQQHDDNRIPPRPRDNSRHANDLIYGALPVLEALRARGRRIDKILVAEGIREHRLSEIMGLARQHGIAVNFAPRASLDKHAGQGTNHQGIIAFSAAAAYVEIDDICNPADNDPLILILDGIEDPQNLGAVIRSAECAGCDGVIIPERRAVGLTDVVAKSSAGAIEYVKVAKAPNLNRLIKDLKERNIWIVGTSADAETDYTDWDWCRPTAIVLGGEGAGLHRLVAENCDVLVKIPMYGKIESLNVSAAASVLLFEARRQRKKS